MTHEDAGHYAAKHPEGAVDQKIAGQIAKREKGGRVSCAAAHEIARQLGCPPKQVGMNIDLLEKRINRCQMGLFGYGSAKPKAVKPASAVSPDLAEAIEAIAVDERISCLAAWELADRMNMTRLDVACACETMGIKIYKCQLGAF